ncbi:hypothetical protein M513_09379 [Trichuris suis]|uniref:Uncharacterized protein n=1 Tax=Trichuris suis TaxID=68888 RepID=A0A085LXI6_9BILA|nr:hypothetical protein M513_09379 [Trichuris suis]
MYPEALANLRRLFGDSSRALDMHIHSLLNIAPMKSNSKEEVERFFFEVRGAVSTFRALGSNIELQSKATLHSVSTKLTYKLKTAWARRAFDLLPKMATLIDFDKWLEEMVIVRNSVGDSEADSSQAKKLPRRPKSTRQVNVLTSSTGTIVCRICELNHPLEQCPQFLSLSPLCRAETLKNFGLCFRFIDSSHRARSCRSRRKCGVDGCRLRHHPLCPPAPRVYAPAPAQREERSATNFRPSSESTMIGTTVTNASEVVLLSVVPVMIASGDRVVSTYALLDAGSEGSLITERLARQLHLAKDRCQLRLSTFHGQDPPQELFKTTFQIRSVRGEKTFDIKNAIVVPSLNVSNRTIDWSRIKGRLRHLNDLPLVKIDYAQVELLLGADNFDATRSIEVRRPARKGQPYGVKTPLGWTVCGRFEGRTPLGWTVCGRFSLSKEERILHSVHINRVIVKAAEDETPLIETCNK